MIAPYNGRTDTGEKQTMMTILAATDGSPDSRVAQQAIFALPLATPPTVHLLSVTSIPIPMSELAVEEALLEEAREYQKTEVAQRIAAEAAAISPRCEAVATELRLGDPGTEIVAAADHIHADLIVLGAHGASAIRRFLLGSVSEYVCHHASCPVLVVRLDAPRADGSQPESSPPSPPVPRPIRRILFAIDGSDLCQAAVETFSKLPLGPEVEVTLISVQSTINPARMDIVQTVGGLWSNVTAKQRGQMEWAEETLRKVTPNVESILVEGAQIAHEILLKAEERQADLIVMGDRGRSPLSRFFLGSVSNTVLRHAHCSVWVQKLKH